MHAAVVSLLCKPRNPFWLLCVCSLALFVGGCQKVEGKKLETIPTTVQQTDIEKIKGFLDAAGAQGEVFRVEDGKDDWVVELVPPIPKDGNKRAALLGNRVYRINKITGNVKDEGVTGG